MASAQQAGPRKFPKKGGLANNVFIRTGLPFLVFVAGGAYALSYVSLQHFVLCTTAVQIECTTGTH